MAGEKRIVWMPINGKDEEFWLRSKEAKNEREMASLLMEAHKKGWVYIFGITDMDPDDLLAVLQEHFKVIKI